MKPIYEELPPDTDKTAYNAIKSVPNSRRPSALIDNASAWRRSHDEDLPAVFAERHKFIWIPVLLVLKYDPFTHNGKLMSCERQHSGERGLEMILMIRPTYFYRHNPRLILARLRFESEGGRLPGSGGKILEPSSSASTAGKKRALPSWAPGSTGGVLNKKASPPKATAQAPAGGGLFTPSYEPPPSSTLDEARSEKIFTPVASRPWTVDVILKLLKEAGPSGATPKVRQNPCSHRLSSSRCARRNFCRMSSCFPVIDVLTVTNYLPPSTSRSTGGMHLTSQAMLAKNPTDERSLRNLLESLQDDFVVFTKPTHESSQPLYLAL